MGIRLDSASAFAGAIVSPHYDSLLVRTKDQRVIKLSCIYIHMYVHSVLITNTLIIGEGHCQSKHFGIYSFKAQ